MIETITLTGGLPRDAVLKFTPSGAAVANFTIAQSDNRLNEETKQWEKTRSLFLDVTIWDETPDRKANPVQWAHLAGDLTKGTQVAVVGKLFTSQWEDKQSGDKRSKVEFLATRFYELPDPNTTQSAQPSQGTQAANWNTQQSPQGGFQNAQANINAVMGGDNEPPF